LNLLGTTARPDNNRYDSQPSRDHERTLTLDHQTSHFLLNRITKMSAPTATSFFRVTLMRSAIGLPRKSSGVLKALGLHKRLRTVYHPVTPDVAGQIFAVKELVDVQEVDQKLTHGEMKELRKPDTGFWVEKKAAELRR
jgi:large subunit ribosomal protein L30